MRFFMFGTVPFEEYLRKLYENVLSTWGNCNLIQSETHFVDSSFFRNHTLSSQYYLANEKGVGCILQTFTAYGIDPARLDTCRKEQRACSRRKQRKKLKHMYINSYIYISMLMYIWEFLFSKNSQKGLQDDKSCILSGYPTWSLSALLHKPFLYPKCLTKSRHHHQIPSFGEHWLCFSLPLKTSCASLQHHLLQQNWFQTFVCPAC